jgi:hypothetical protein
LTTPSLHQTVLEYGHHRYLKLALLLCGVSVFAYLRDPAPIGRYGGTWVGYGLGILGALLILLLLWFGVRKRRYQSRMGTLQGWLSAHVYLGASLLVIVTLHTGFEVGWNVHTLAYGLMVLVILSGFYGIYAYARYPKLITAVMGEETLDGLLLKIASLDAEARKAAMTLPDEISQAVLKAAEETRIGGGVLAQLRGDDPHCPTTRALDLLKESVGGLTMTSTRASQTLFSALSKKQALLRRARQAVMYKARLDLWLYAHVPMSVALLGALVAHIVAVFFYRG